ncbi:MAG TPA: patatin-like phospholipase family protein [Longimicrobiales bacterium]
MDPEVPHNGGGAAPRGELALALTGGGARAAYQVGLLVWLARRYPELEVPILTGVSAGAVNAAHLASHAGTFREAVTELARLWSDLSPEDVFRVDTRSLAGHFARWAARLTVGGLTRTPAVRGLVDTTPLRRLLEDVLCAEKGEIVGIADNLRRGRLKAVAVSTTSYGTGRSVAWAQGREIQGWARPNRLGVQTTLTVDHIMASAALPLFFPAVRIGDDWHGDGGIRLAAPLSPALHLGAGRIIAISTRYVGSRAEAEAPVTVGYPPPAQVLGVLMNAIFLDVIDQDALRLERLNRLLQRLPEDRRDGLRIVDLLVLRPSRDLSRLARDYEPRLPRAFRVLTRALGTRQTLSPDALSLVMFQADYLRRLIELGEADAEARAEEIDQFIRGERESG